MKPQLHQPRLSMAFETPVERIPWHIGLGGSILARLIRLLLLIWVLVTAAILWQLR